MFHESMTVMYCRVEDEFIFFSLVFTFEYDLRALLFTIYVLRSKVTSVVFYFNNKGITLTRIFTYSRFDSNNQNYYALSIR